jgi:hypothetical protein
MFQIGGSNYGVGTSNSNSDMGICNYVMRGWENNDNR